MYLLPNQCGVQATRSSMPRNACVVLTRFKRLATRVQRAEKRTVGKVMLPRACRVGRPYVVVVVPHHDLIRLEGL